ncbi:FAD binding domain-containing protein [Mytilinidion resinicola]|uniref:L-ornithine N(5)-monooxygenase [NAD(P)H] n=1 Tax=Mytilinidion resinicola TaxID=574789 RepID=A0A6A6Y4F0_9PEZI|nr:FAD binding domain-containing protein [Mytilinidion resinicola]KAF2803509.1 FAD binding domain-containing protein [Mytilinidion resinicola]
MDSKIHDVLIIGAGPCGLVVAARLCEHTPSAVFTDEEHQRYHWILKHGHQTSIKSKKTGTVYPPRQSPAGRSYSALVLDSTRDEWMTRGNRLFKTFEIEHLRSPMFFYVDPGDRDGLLANAHEEGREGELSEIRECVGKEVSKHLRKKRMKFERRGELHLWSRAEVVIDERDRNDYFTPSRGLFAEHCRCVIDRYGLREGLVRQESVQDVGFREVENVAGESERIFTLETNKGIHYARSVVLAVGPGNAPAIPGLSASERTDGACQSMQIQRFPGPSVQSKIKAKRVTNVMVIGGGVTSAQLVDLAVRRGVTKVWHVMRGPLKVKPFDVDLVWMGKFRNIEQAYFWYANSDNERLAHLATARNGGSVTPRALKAMKAHIAAHRASLYSFTTIQSKTWNPESHTWTVTTSPQIPDLPPFDYIYFATGIATDISTLPFLGILHREFLIKTKDDVPLLGRLAGLRLGPGAGNLAGARVGAERVVWGIEDVLGKSTNGVKYGKWDWQFDYASGRGNRFDSLTGEDCRESKE